MKAFVCLCVWCVSVSVYAQVIDSVQRWICLRERYFIVIFLAIFPFALLSILGLIWQRFLLWVMGFVWPNEKNNNIPNGGPSIPITAYDECNKMKIKTFNNTKHLERKQKLYIVSLLTHWRLCFFSCCVLATFTFQQNHFSICFELIAYD